MYSLWIQLKSNKMKIINCWVICGSTSVRIWGEHSRHRACITGRDRQTAEKNRHTARPHWWDKRYFLESQGSFSEEALVQYRKILSCWTERKPKKRTLSARTQWARRNSVSKCFFFCFVSCKILSVKKATGFRFCNNKMSLTLKALLQPWQCPT